MLGTSGFLIYSFVARTGHIRPDRYVFTHKIKFNRVEVDSSY